MNLLNEIREFQNELNVMCNTFFEKIAREVENLEQNNQNEQSYESKYPITNATGFKGKKSLAVIISNNRYIAPTWVKVVEIVLKDAMKDERRREKLLGLRDLILGRTRVRVSAKDENMKRPLKLMDDLFIETHYDTESLIKLLLQILDAIGYNYRDIQVVVKN